jgi:hypothetical protein
VTESRTEADEKRKKTRGWGLCTGKKKKNSSATGILSHRHRNITGNGH